MSMNDMRGLWHGKRVNNGEWVKGYYMRIVRETSIKKIIRHCIFTGVEFWDNLSGETALESYEVDPSTLGECVGFPDKNGMPIFDGDIVRHYCYKGEPTRFEVGVIFWEEKHARFKRTSNDGDTYFIVYDEACPYEVIGNIHNNSELLKGAENNGSRG